MPTIPRHVRSYIYGVALALGPVAILYGWLSTEEVAVWGGVLLVALGLGTARVYTPSVEEEEAMIRARNASQNLIVNQPTGDPAVSLGDDQADLALDDLPWTESGDGGGGKHRA